MVEKQPRSLRSWLVRITGRHTAAPMMEGPMMGSDAMTAMEPATMTPGMAGGMAEPEPTEPGMPMTPSDSDSAAMRSSAMKH